MSNLFSYIFLVRGGRIAVYNKIGDQFICTSFYGEKSLAFNADFWKVWQETFSYDPESCRIDFAFVSTDPHLRDFLVPDSFKKTEHSGWTTSEVQAFMHYLFAVRPYILWEDDVQLHFVPDRNVDNYYVTRFNIEQEKKPEETPRPIYEHMVNDPLPAEIIEELQKKI